MGRKKNEGNGAATPRAGHNSTLTDEEKRALTLHHSRAYQAADSLVEKAKADRTAVVELAKADLGKGAKADIVDMLTANTPAKMKAPTTLAQDAAQQWTMGWHEGQTILMAAFKKKRIEEPPKGGAEATQSEQAAAGAAAH